MLRSILVPLDGSAFGEHALPLALALARRAGAALHLVHVHQLLPATLDELTVLDQVEATLRKEEWTYLGGVAQRLAAVAPVKVDPVLLDGEVAQALHDRAVETRADLVVLSTHGRGPLSRFWLGSVADKLVRRLPMPVLLVRPKEGPADLAAEPPLKHVLVPLDGTPLAEQALEPALKVGALTGARFTLLRVVKPAVLPQYVGEGSTVAGLHDSVLQDLRARQRRLEEEARAYLDAVADRLRQRGVPVQTRVVVEESPALGILGEIQEHGADLVALATHGRRGLSRLLLGSVADKVLRGASVPVLLHRPLDA
jgi:nucleotide-binding universal stress UspA family protein